MSDQTTEDRPVGELIQEASQQTALLVRQELALAQLEMKEKGKRAGMGAGLFGGAGAVAFYGGGVLIAAIKAPPSIIKIIAAANASSPCPASLKFLVNTPKLTASKVGRSGRKSRPAIISKMFC